MCYHPKFLTRGTSHPIFPQRRLEQISTSKHFPSAGTRRATEGVKPWGRQLAQWFLTAQGSRAEQRPLCPLADCGGYIHPGSRGNECQLAPRGASIARTGQKQRGRGLGCRVPPRLREHGELAAPGVLHGTVPRGTRGFGLAPSISSLLTASPGQTRLFRQLFGTNISQHSWLVLGTCFGVSAKQL